jgi:L-serine kinase (ADP)
LGSRGLGFRLETPQITLEIALEELSRLHIHEEIIPVKMGELVVKMPGDGVFIHPIIVDAGSLVVLDGMHRVAAAKQIGFRYIPVCLVDYFNPHIQLGGWYRMFGGLTEAEATAAIVESGLTPVKKAYEEAHRMVEGREAVTALFSKNWCLAAMGDPPDIKARYDAVKRIERILQRGHQMGYSTDKEARSRVESGEFSASLMTPTATKREVVDTALAGRVFAQKTTRHIIPARPMNVNVPIAWLRGDADIEEVNRRLREHLAGERVEKLPPGQVIDRRYDEELYVFKEKE